MGDLLQKGKQKVSGRGVTWHEEFEFKLAIAYGLQGHEIGRKPLPSMEPSRCRKEALQWARFLGSRVMESTFTLVLIRNNDRKCVFERVLWGRDFSMLPNIEGGKGDKRAAELEQKNAALQPHQAKPSEAEEER